MQTESSGHNIYVQAFYASWYFIKYNYQEFYQHALYMSFCLGLVSGSNVSSVENAVKITQKHRFFQYLKQYKRNLMLRAKPKALPEKVICLVQ